MSFRDYMTTLFPTAFVETLYMILVPTIIASIIGFIIAIILVITKEDGLKPNRTIYNTLGLIVNVFRSFPFIILIVAISSFTRLVVGTSIGNTAALVPITVGTAPFMARLIESSLNEVDKGLIEAAKSFGATNVQIIFKVMVKESVQDLSSDYLSAGTSSESQAQQLVVFLFQTCCFSKMDGSAWGRVMGMLGSMFKSDVGNKNRQRKR